MIDVSIVETKKTFNLNVWSYITMTQTFLSLLLKFLKDMIVNQMFVKSSCIILFQVIYNTFKFAIVIISDTCWLKLKLFYIKVVDLRIAVIKTNLIKNIKEIEKFVLSKKLIYVSIKKVIKKSLR